MLRRNRLSTECLSELSDILKRNRVVKEVMFSESSIGSVGAGLIASALKVNNCLEELQIWEDSIGSKGADELSKMIEWRTWKQKFQGGLNSYPKNSMLRIYHLDGVLPWACAFGELNGEATGLDWGPAEIPVGQGVPLDSSRISAWTACTLTQTGLAESCVEHLLCPLSSCLTDADDQSEHDTAIMETLQVNPWIEELDLARTPLQNSGKTEEIYQKLGQNDKTEPETDLLKGMSMVVPKSC
ncbi:tornado 1 [Actinidia rufa]|uniref:Tornado 1 n=1 Tax=Actinidia rufa TaxID=165716 RepID=A0A7J0G2N1_9ERIC|nr:tornado 1 [Actinidia rufa]